MSTLQCTYIYRKWNSDLNNYFHNVYYTFVYLYTANGKVILIIVLINDLGLVFWSFALISSFSFAGFRIFIASWRLNILFLVEIGD